MGNIKISELSIGDWVKCLGEPMQVYWIEGDSVGMGVADVLYYSCNVAEVKPIPLTPEILDKNGWHDYISEYNDDVEKLCYENGDIIAHSFSSIYFKGGEYYFGEECGYFKTITIKYVHQLQHALRLAGVEKEIEI